jgi:prepilin-type N-terminal cleavage/methylation domain-containing protein
MRARGDRRQRGFTLLEMALGLTVLGVIGLLAGGTSLLAIGASSNANDSEQVQQVAESAEASRAASGMAAPYTCSDYRHVIQDQGSNDPLTQCTIDDSRAGQQIGDASTALTHGQWGVTTNSSGQALVHVTGDGNVIAWHTSYGVGGASALWFHSQSACTGPVTSAGALASDSAQPC